MKKIQFLFQTIIEDKYYEKLGVKNSISNYEFLKSLSWQGVKDRGIDKFENKQEYYDRAKMELDVFFDLGFVGQGNHIANINYYILDQNPNLPDELRDLNAQDVLDYGVF